MPASCQRQGEKFSTVPATREMVRDAVACHFEPAGCTTYSKTDSSEAHRDALSGTEAVAAPNDTLSEGPHHYDVTGIVRSITPSGSHLVVEHEAIPVTCHDDA
jgi:hypothetical protein